MPGYTPAQQKMADDFKASMGYGSTPPTGKLPPNPYQTGVTSGYLDASGNQQYAPTNPMQFATPQAAQGIATMLGGRAYGDQLTGPGMGWSTPQQLINIPGMQGSINAGLAANTLGMYGSAPGSYGQFELARDIAQNSGQQFNDNYNAWATSQPGWKPDPNLANSGPGFNMTPDGKGGFFNSAGMDASQMGAAYTQPTPPSGQPPGVPPGMVSGQDGVMMNGVWMPKSTGSMNPATVAPVAQVGPQAPTTFTPPPGGAAGSFPFSPPPTPEQTPEQPPAPTINETQPQVYPGTTTPTRPVVGHGGGQTPYQTDSRTHSYGGYGQAPTAQGNTSPYPSSGYGGYSAQQPYQQGTSATTYGSSQYGNSSPYGYGSSYGNSGGNYGGNYGSQSNYGGYGGQSSYRDQAQSGQSSYGGGYNGQQLGQGSYGGYGDPRRSSQKAFGDGASSGGGNSTF